MFAAQEVQLASPASNLAGSKDKGYNDSLTKSRIFLDDGTQRRAATRGDSRLSSCYRYENGREQYLLHTSGILFAQPTTLSVNGESLAPRQSMKLLFA